MGNLLKKNEDGEYEFMDDFYLEISNEIID